ncbi:MAG: hypothetical protein RL172_854 [Bacteroidota bacterium]|jgi:glycosyltransferase involved in cell wall biosynthesis
MKKTILHIIDNLGRGGAETMLVTVVKQLQEYNNIIVTLSPENDFGTDLQCDGLYCLDMRTPLQAPLAAVKLRGLIKKHAVSIVHSHLFWSTIVARLGVPRNVTLVTTIHAFVASSIEYKPWHMRLAERLTYLYKKSTIIAVAQGALDEYFSFINVKPYKASHLYTFVNPDVFRQTDNKNDDATFRVVTVGNLKEQKNHQFLLEAFQHLKGRNVSLDIYGKGPLQHSLQQMIDEQQLNVTLKGQVSNIQEEVGKYDLFVMSSTYEGFALSVLEAMALGMPLLLSDIVSFKEQCADTAMYYTAADPADFGQKLLQLKHNGPLLQSMGNACKARVLKHFTLHQHMSGLRNIYAASHSSKQQPVWLPGFAK